MNLRVLLLAVALTTGRLAAAEQPGTPVPVVRLNSGGPYSFTYYSGLAEPKRTVVRDAWAWAEAWAAIWQGRSPTPTLPAVDFEREIIIVVALGARPTGGYSILVDSATATTEGVSVLIRTVSPGRDCGVTEGLTQPVDIARLPRPVDVVVFREQAAVHKCD